MGAAHCQTAALEPKAEMPPWLPQAIIAGIAGLLYRVAWSANGMPARLISFVGITVVASSLTYAFGGPPSLAIPLATIGGLAIALVISAAT